MPEKKGYLSKTACSNLYCPTAQAVIDAAAAQAETAEEIEHINTNILKSDALCDATGHYWCKGCEDRYEIINYGAKHDWPAVNFPPYAVAHDETVWKLLCGMGKPDCIRAWRIALGLDESEG